jgi:hypothetical protein
MSAGNDLSSVGDAKVSLIRCLSDFESEEAWELDSFVLLKNPNDCRCLTAPDERICGQQVSPWLPNDQKGY